MTSLTLAALSARMLPYARVSFLLSQPRSVCTTLVMTAVGGFLSDLNLLISDRDADELGGKPKRIGRWLAFEFADRTPTLLFGLCLFLRLDW